jgi:hypothetical protein
MNIPDLIFENLVSVFWVKILKLFDADPDPGSCQPWSGYGIRDGKKSDPVGETHSLQTLNIYFQF